MPPVGFQFLFAGSAHPDAPRRAASAAFAAEAGHLRAASGQPRQQIIQLRQFHLQLAFTAARVTRENIENELRAIDHAALGDFFDVALLHRGKIAVENDQRRVVGVRRRAHLFEFASANQRGGIRGVAHLKNRAGHFAAGAFRQFHEFGQRFPALLPRGHAGKARRALPADAHQEHAFRIRNRMLCFHARGGAKGSAMQPVQSIRRSSSAFAIQLIIRPIRGRGVNPL